MFPDKIQTMLKRELSYNEMQNSNKRKNEKSRSVTQWLPEAEEIKNTSRPATSSVRFRE